MGTELCDKAGSRIGKHLPALDLAKKVKEEMEDPTSTNISDVELFVNLTKDETIQKFRDIRELGKKIMREDKSSLGSIIVVIGFMFIFEH